jgi:hypothetical protein
MLPSEWRFIYSSNLRMPKRRAAIVTDIANRELKRWVPVACYEARQLRISNQCAQTTVGEEFGVPSASMCI